jgi:hypothetical protein
VTLELIVALKDEVELAIALIDAETLTVALEDANDDDVEELLVETDGEPLEDNVANEAREDGEAVAEDEADGEGGVFFKRRISVPSSARLNNRTSLIDPEKNSLLPFTLPFHPRRNDDGNVEEMEKVAEVDATLDPST